MEIICIIVTVGKRKWSEAPIGMTKKVPMRLLVSTFA